MIHAEGEIAYGLPGYSLRVLEALEDAGHETWVVGGWVRDALRGAAPHDVDLTTSARWQEVEGCLASAGVEVHRTGIAHGTVTAVCEGHPIEVTTYRVEGGYSDHRHPDEVRFVRDVREDLARRDFTINAMAYHPVRGLLDPFGGRADLAGRVVRAVGEPSERFGEDALRVLRAVRFACRLGFEVEGRTQRALVAHAPELAGIASERIGLELAGIVRSGRTAWALEHQTEVLCQAIPELAPMAGFDQRSPYHAFDVLGHTAHVCRGVEEFTGGNASDALRWAALLHDVAKPSCYSEDEGGRGHFFGHPKLGAQMAESIMRRLALPGELVSATRALVRLHDHAVRPTSRSIRRTLLKLERACPDHAKPLAFDLLDLKRADAVAKVPGVAGYAAELDQVSAALRREIASGSAYRLKDLPVSGADVMRVTGIQPGPGVGLILAELLSAVVNDELPNRREVLLGQIRL